MIFQEIDQIVKEFLVEEGANNERNFFRYRMFAINGYREYHMDSSGAPTSKIIPYDSTKFYIDLPPDCIKPLAIGKVTKENRLLPLIVNDGMLLNDKESPSFKSAIFVENEGVVTRSFGGDYVAGPAYREDYLNNRIKISGNFNAKCIYLEYLADIKKIDGAFKVPVYMIETIKAWIRYSNVRSNPASSQATRYDFKQQLYEAEENMNMRFSTQTIQDWIHEYRKTKTAAPKG